MKFIFKIETLFHEGKRCTALRGITLFSEKEHNLLSPIGRLAHLRKMDYNRCTLRRNITLIS